MALAPPGPPLVVLEGTGPLPGLRVEAAAELERNQSAIAQPAVDIVAGDGGIHDQVAARSSSGESATPTRTSTDGPSPSPSITPSTPPYGAPTAGHPPYRVYELTPAVAYAFGTGSNLEERSTRYRFDR